MNPSDATFYLIRHGETEGNARRVLQPPEIPLSAHGRDQAARLGERLRGAGLALIVSSDLTRAAMTARAVQETSGARIVYEPLLQERNFGHLRGTPYAELATDPFAPDYEPPGGEGWDVFHERTARAWDAVRHHLEATAGPVAVVTHGLVCRAFVAHHLEVPEELGDAGAIRGWRNTSVTIAEARAPWRIHRLDCADHLDGLAPPSDSGAA